MKQALYTLCNQIVYILSRLTPRFKKRWVFIGWHIGSDMEVFADNTKYLFLHVANNRPDIQPVWLAKDRALAALLRARGYLSYYQYSLRGACAALCAGTTVIDAFFQPQNFRLSGRSRLVQLLHGKGMKKDGYAEPPPRHQDIIFSTSPYVTGMLPKVFVQDTPVVEAGYPRDDVFFTEIPGSDIGTDKASMQLLLDQRYKKRFLYAPTFRRGQKTLNIQEHLDLHRISEWLQKESCLLLISLHPKYRTQARTLSYPNIHFVEDSDMYPLLPFVDALINDYSSLFTDYLLLDRPIIFYPYDLQTYKEKEGLTYDDYDSYTPGPKAYTFEQLLSTLTEALVQDTWAAERGRVRAMYHTHQNGGSSKRVIEALQDRAASSNKPE